MTRSALALLFLAVGCSADEPVAVGSDLPSPNGSPSSETSQTQGDPGDSGTGDAPGEVDDSATGGSEGDGPSETTQGPQSCDDGCESPPSDCYQPVGECIDEQCEYTPKAEGVACDDGDACTQGEETCDGAGSCVAAETLSCDRPNAENGSCVEGECQGWTCIAPYENCDGDWENGCEIPTGLPNSCNNTGMTEEGACGTAYCGTEIGPNIVNFANENYRCVMCSNCYSPEEGSVAWCNQSTGSWWPTEAGDCPAAYEQATCEP